MGGKRRGNRKKGEKKQKRDLKEIWKKKIQK